MKEIKNRKQNPTAEESSAAMEMQRPLLSAEEAQQIIAADMQSMTTRGEDMPATSLQRVSTFKQLAKVSRSSRLAFGSASQWVKPEMLFNPAYRDGLETPPFYITKAFKYKSKEIKGDRLGIEIIFSNAKSYNIGFGLNEKDSVRNGILAAFTGPDGKPRQDAEPIGMFSMTALPTGKGNNYWNIQPFVQANEGGPDVDIPFIEVDNEMPF